MTYVLTNQVSTNFISPFKVFDFDTSKTMAIKVPIISGTGPFKYLNGVLCDAAWINYNNEGYKNAYLMKATCKISDSKMEKIKILKNEVSCIRQSNICCK